MIPALRVPAILLAVALAAGCSSAPKGTVANGAKPGGAGVNATDPLSHAATVKPLKHRVRPDVLVVSAKALPAGTLARLKKLAPGGFTTFRSGTVRLGARSLAVAGVDPSSFRSFAPSGTAEADAVWQGVARNELVLAHDYAKRNKIPLGRVVPVGGLRLRVAALATTLPDVDAVVSNAVADALKLPAANAALLHAGKTDPADLAVTARRAAGAAAIHLLTQPKLPTAFLTGGAAAKLFGAFSYRWHEDGTIEPDAAWVRQNIVWATMPVVGGVSCHRLIVPQLRNAFREIEARGLGAAIRTFDGCYVPRFIERNPEGAVSLHTWGIAFDLNALSNMPGANGDMNAEVVAVFKRWGFRWGGDWSVPDPMHFELGALVSS